MNRVYFSNQATALLPFEEVLVKVSKYYKGWEISSEYKQSLPLIKDKFLQLTPSYDIKFQAHAPLSDINIASPNPNIRKTALNEVLDCIRVARELDIGIVTFHPGFISPLTIDDKDLAFRLNRESILTIDRAGIENGVKLALENMPKMFLSIGTTIESLLEFIEGTELKICFDFGHANTAGSIDGFLDHADVLRNIHMHDNNSDRDSHLIPGHGTINFKKYMKKLKKYTGNFVFEAGSIEDGIKGKKIIDELVELSS